MALFLAAGAFGLALFYYHQETENLYQQYMKIESEKGSAAGGYPIEFQRPPKVVWQDPSDLICQPGMPEGDGAVLPIEGSFRDKGIFACPKTNVMKSNIYYPLYRTECLFI
jgi:hypothetical protein